MGGLLNALRTSPLSVRARADITAPLASWVSHLLGWVREEHVTGKESKEFIKRCYAELIDKKNLSLFDEFYASDFYHRNTKEGAQWYRSFLEKLHDAFPEIRYEIEDVIAERDIVVCWGIYNCGVQAKDWAGIAPKGNSLVFHGTTLHRIRDGEIIEQWHDQWYRSVPEMLERGSDLERLPRPREIRTSSGTE